MEKKEVSMLHDIDNRISRLLDLLQDPKLPPNQVEDLKSRIEYLRSLKESA